MEMLINNRYKMYNIDANKLKKYGFKYSRNVSDSDNSFYYYKFTLEKYKSFPTLEGNLLIDSDSGEVRVDVFQCGISKYYAPFYNKECDKPYKDMIKSINSKFKRKFNKFNIKKVGKDV